MVDTKSNSPPILIPCKEVKNFPISGVNVTKTVGLLKEKMILFFLKFIS